MTNGPEGFKPLLEKRVSIEREKIIKYLQNRMEYVVNALKEKRKKVGRYESLQSRDKILRDVSFIKGRAHEIYQGTMGLIEEVSGEKFPQLKKELSKKYFDEVMKLADQIIEESDQADSMAALEDLSRLEDADRSK
jgi:hypothetical protein